MVLTILGWDWGQGVIWLHCANFFVASINGVDAGVHGSICMYYIWTVVLLLAQMAVFLGASVQRGADGRAARKQDHQPVGRHRPQYLRRRRALLGVAVGPRSVERQQLYISGARRAES